MSVGTEITELAWLAERVRGPVIAPRAAAYDGARAVWNGAIDRRPAAIVRCAGTSDVVAALRLARERGLVVSVRGGGHNVAGLAVCDGGIVIDLSPLKGIRVDPVARTARAQPGVLWGELDRATQAQGLATTGGIQSTTGISGFTLGGGIGWLSRRHGHACDNLLSATVVTAEGEVLTASAAEDPDLLFGLLGGGGNFGIATSLEYRLHPLDGVVGGMVLHRMERAAEVLAFYRDWTAELPDELSAILFFLTAPDASHIPPALRGRPVVSIGVCHAGPAREAEALLAPLRRFGPPEADLVRRMPYVELQGQFDAANPAGQQNYWKAEYLGGLDDSTIQAIVEVAAQRPPGLSKVLLPRLGGAASRVPEDATAFGHRGAPYIINIIGMTPDPGELGRVSRWARELWAAVQPASFGGVYVNFLGDEGEARVRAAYGEAKYERLVALKRRFDPANVFRLNQNIRP
jgi:FAD/FMN-containing dehydrogenase